MRLPLASDYDQLLKGNIDRDVPEADRKVSDQQIQWIDKLVTTGNIVNGWNWRLFLNGDSRDPEMAGLKAGHRRLAADAGGHAGPRHPDRDFGGGVS